MKCFAVNFNSLKGVLSPLFFLSTPQNTSGYIALKEVAKINPKRTIGNLTMDTNVPYIGLPETDDKEVKHILTRPYMEVVGRNIIRNGDILFSRIEPSIFNKKYIYAKLKTHDYAFASTEFYIVEPSEDINPKFLFHMFFFDAVYTQILGKTTGSTGRRRLDKGVFENIFIPYPSKEKQKKIADLLDSADEYRKQKEAEAQELLDSIDRYVLGELGITIRSAEDRLCFSISSDLVCGNRLDSYYYQPKFINIEESLNASKYKIFSLDNLISDLSGGATPKIGEDYYTEDGEIPFLRVQNITPQGIILDGVKYIKKEIHNGMLKRSQLKEDDLVFTITGRIGSVAVVPNGFEGNINQHSVRISLKKGIDETDINPYYVACFCNTSLGNILALRKTTGGTRPALDYNAIREIRIPLPTYETQNRIATEVQSRMNQADELQQQAKVKIDKAKAEVERLILGKA